MSSNIRLKLINNYKLCISNALRILKPNYKNIGLSIKKIRPNFHIFRPNFSKIKSLEIDVKATAEYYEKKYKGTIFERWILFWKFAYIDYTDVLINVIKESREFPLRTCGYLAGLGLLWLIVKLNPDERSFRDALLTWSNEIILVHPSIQRANTVQYLRLVEKCYNTNYIRYTSFGVFSIMWVDNFSRECGLYENKCDYFKLKYSNFFQRIIDFGFFNKWWFMEKHVANYDINESILPE